MAHVARAAASQLRHLQFNHFLFPPTTTTSTSTTITLHHLSFLTLPSYRSHAHFRSRGLRLPREVDLEEEEAAPETKDRKSRNDMKREARQAVRWGMDLASFSTPQIKRILKAASLEPEVFEALMLVKKLGPDVREGKRRQFNYIGKLLRDAEPNLLGALIQATKDGDHSRLHALAGSVVSVDEDPEEELPESESESDEEYEVSSDHIILANKWFDGLVNKDIQISNEVYSVDEVEFDRQELRRLVRKVHTAQGCQSDEEDESVELTSAKKSLNRFLCSLTKRLSVVKSQSVIM